MAELAAGILLSENDPGLNTTELIQQVAALMWLNQGDDHKEFYQKMTGMRVFNELWARISGQREVQAYENQCIMAIADYVKKHPKASEAELAKEVQKQIELFKERCEAM